MPPGFRVTVGSKTSVVWCIWETSLIFTCLSSVQLLSHVRLFATPWTAAYQVSQSITNSQLICQVFVLCSFSGCKDIEWRLLSFCHVRTEITNSSLNSWIHWNNIFLDCFASSVSIIFLFRSFLYQQETKLFPVIYDISIWSLITN